VKKHIVVLANSVKHDPGRCIAGREVGPAKEIGPWLRPVSLKGEGELQPAQFMLEGGGVPQVFDVIELAVETLPTVDATQPENWLISDDAHWRRIGKWDINKVAQLLVETPLDIWLQLGVKTDRVTKEYLAAHPPSQSLYLLLLHNARIAQDNHKYRLSFKYKGSYYDLGITDPLIRNVTLPPAGGSVIACVSLAPAFYNKYDGREYHYKLAAMVRLP
jgi:hypothetical protein